MESLGDLGLGLSIVFGFLLLALVAELYYLLWWKRRIASTEIEHEDGTCRNSSKGFLQFLCWRKPSYRESTNTQQNGGSAGGGDQETAINEQADLELGSKDLLLKNFGEETIEAELMRLHNLAGPPRFLFTINEETKEDLESEDGKSRDRSRKGSRSRSLSDVMVALDHTPFLTPLSSPSRKVPHLETYSHHGFNPLFESSTVAELNRLRSSPPPKFKFLRDAEEKLLRRLMEEAERRKALKNAGSVQDTGVKSQAASAEEKEGSFIRIIVGKNRDKETQNQQHLPQFHSGSAQVLPLCSSPSTFIPPD